ncbi:MAG: hypothetical protein KAI96_01850 [Thermodesulfovibrionia bacterium]|nr:hypothetical protein [Thermodesulfovibrionia bacterium]
MAAINSREQKPVPGIDYSEIRIPDEENLGTGTFKTVLLPNAMAKNCPIINTIVNVPVFQLMVNINSAENEVTVLLGKADKSPALFRRVFKLSENLDLSKAYSFEVTFSHWKIKDLKMNRKKLQTVN